MDYHSRTSRTKRTPGREVTGDRSPLASRPRARFRAGWRAVGRERRPEGLAEGRRGPLRLSLLKWEVCVSLCAVCEPPFVDGQMIGALLAKH
jgi:hypothetical protein